MSTDLFWNTAFWALVWSILGARIYHVLDYSNYYFENPMQMFAIHKGGLGILGALIGGTCAIVFSLRNKKEELAWWLDVVALYLPLGQSIGRIANIYNKELLPVAYYEMALTAVLFAILFTVEKIYRPLDRSKQNTPTPSGLLTSIYVIGYALIRIGLESFREHRWQIGNTNISVTISIVLVLLGFTNICRIYLQQKKV